MMISLTIVSVLASVKVMVKVMARAKVKVMVKLMARAKSARKRVQVMMLEETLLVTSKELQSARSRIGYIERASPVCD